MDGAPQTDCIIVIVIGRAHCEQGQLVVHEELHVISIEIVETVFQLLQGKSIGIRSINRTRLHVSKHYGRC